MKFCPYCGHALAARQVHDRERPACPNCGHVILLNPALTAGVVAVDGAQRVLLILRGEEPRRGMWGLPAGFMEADETAEECARRECLEETGVQVALDGLYGVYSYHHTTSARAGVLILYRAHIAGGAPTIGPDALAVRFFRRGEIPFEGLAFATHIEALRRWEAEGERGPAR